MNIKNISFFSLLLITSFINSNDGIEKKPLQDINAELSAIHKKIKTSKEKLTLANNHKEQQWEILTTCRSKKNDADKELSWYQLSMYDCSSYEQLFRDDYFHNINKDGYNTVNAPVIKARHEYTTINSAYNDFQLTLKRCKRHHDIDCLNNLDKEIREWNKK